MDIHGEIGYNPDTIDVSVKGELEPWALFDSELDKEFDLSELDDEQELIYYNDLFNNNFEHASEVVVGLYPVDDEAYEEHDHEGDDTFTECDGEYGFIDKNGEYRSISFTFTEKSQECPSLQ